jgi:hypothetical protein
MLKNIKAKKLYFLYFALAVFSLSSCSYFTAGRSTTRLFPVRQDNRNGYINDRGEIVIQPQFEWAFPFSEGLAVACIDAKKCGFIDESGKFAINPQFDFAYRFSDGLAAVVSGEKIGYIDKAGKYVINPQFTALGSGPGGFKDSYATFSEGLARVVIGNKMGFIDKTGQMVINPQFDSALPFFEGLAATKTGDKWGFIDMEGKLVINPQFDSALPFTNGLAAVLLGKDWGYVDKTGKLAINPQFSSARPFSSEGIAMVTLNQKTGFIDREGKYVVNPQFDGGFPIDVEQVFTVTSDIGRLSFSEGLASVVAGNKMGFVDRSGKIVINPQFDLALPFYGGLALVVIRNGPDESLGWIDNTGKYIWMKSPNKKEVNTNSAANAANAAMNSAMNAANSAANAANAATNPTPAPMSSARTGRLTTDSNIRSEANKESASLGIHFKGAKIRIFDETSYPLNGETSTWYKVKVYEYGCSVDPNLGCGKNNSNDSDEGWINAKNVLLD